MAAGDYEKIEAARRLAWKRHLRSPWGSEEHRSTNLTYDEISAQRETYLRDLLARLPFRWHVAHAYTPRETATYGGADHIVVDEEVRLGRLVRQPGDALSRVRAKFLNLAPVEEGRLPTSIADIKIAERIVAAPPAKKPQETKKSGRQLDAEIADALKGKPA